MSYNNKFAVHLYGVKLGDERFRKEFDNVETDYGAGDQYGILFKIAYGNWADLPPGCPESAWDIAVFDGPGKISYVGYSARMPYEKPIKSKEEMNETIHSLMVYLFGEDVAKEIRPRKIYEVWTE